MDKKELITQLNNLREKNAKLEDFVARVKSAPAQPGEPSETRDMIVGKYRVSQRLIDLVHVIIRDADSRIILWTSGDEKLYGYSKRETVGKVSHDLFKTIFPVAKEAVDEALEKTGHWEGMLVHTAKDGHKVYVASHQVLHREHGKPTAIIEVNNDITEQKRVEERLTASNEELKVTEEELKSNIEELNSAQEQLSEKIEELRATEVYRRLATVLRDTNDAVILTDMGGHILTWNRGAELIYGYPEKEALRMSILDIVPGSERQAYGAMIEELRHGEDIRSFKTKQLSKDGKILDVWLTVTTLKDQNGVPYAIATTGRDITGIKRTEEQLRASNEELKVSEEELKSNIEELNSSQEELREKVEELKATEEPLRRLATVVSDSNDAILLVDFEGDIHAWNRGAERLYGYDEAEVSDKNVQLLIPEADRVSFMDILKRLRKGEEVTSYETRRVTKDGRTLDIWLTLTSLKDESGKTYMVATTERDITEFKKNMELRFTMEKMQFESEQLHTSKEEIEVANEELLSTNSELELAIKNIEESSRLIDYFSLVLIRMLQETQDSLNARIGVTAGELEGGVPPERREVLEILLDDDRKAVTAMHDVTSLLKAFSVKMQIDRVNLSSIVTSIMDNLKREDPHARLYIFIAKALYAYADRGLMEIALQYLLQDAWQHVHEDPNGRIFFMLTHVDMKFSCVIADTRRDFNLAESKWLSEPWEYPVEIPPSKFRLAVAKLIIEKNGGEIWVDDKNGTYSVHFKLPIIPIP